MEIPAGESEYDYAGGVRGEAYEVILGKHTGLPIPAYSEVAIEGEVVPGTKIPEGPFGEFTGYYAGGLRSEPMLKVKRLMYRDDPIITGAPPFKPAPGAENNLIRAAYIWNYLEKAGVPDVRSVAYHQTRLLVAVSIKQRYPGHARQAALVASQCRAAALLTRYVMVVDDDIDIWDSNELLWALCTRTDPAKDIDILRRCWSNPIDPIIPPSERGFQSRGIIDACKPYEWMNEFPKVSGASAALKEKVTKKFSASLAGKKN
jgi:4-hydroxy-3-polyprenylbenzoate decarboxylase